MFRRNCGTVDRSVRLMVGAVVLLVGLFRLGGLQGDIVGQVAAFVGFLMVTTGISGFCILYVPFGISTIEKKKGIPRL
ncbi:MAG: DUF2892 domain-containing protein [Chloroflexi bacterium]|nr:DUF2892 domain-containing protein [Chloroflexota bacterium]